MKIKRICKKISCKIKRLPFDEYPFSDDIENFQNIKPLNQDASEKKIVIFTCVTGGYDNLKDPTFIKPNFKYVAYTDNKNLKTKIWELRDIPLFLKNETNPNINRYIKLHANELFPEFDYAIYIDGSVQITSDISTSLALINPVIGLATFRHCLRNCLYEEAIACFCHNKGNKEYIRKQIKQYKKERFPRNFGLFECTLLFIKIGENSKKLFDAWWSELCRSKSGRDQLALPYVVWKLKIDPKQIAVVGTNVWKSARFTTSKHN